jgi:hypothetical protein
LSKEIIVVYDQEEKTWSVFRFHGLDILTLQLRKIFATARRISALVVKTI